MSTTKMESWLKSRVPGIPFEFLPYLLEYGRAEAPTAEELGARGEEALVSALKRPGRDREAAFTLLTGDALLTYASEASAEEDGDPGEALMGIIQRLGSIFP